MILISSLTRLHTFSGCADPQRADETQTHFVIRPGANFIDRDMLKLWEGVPGKKAVMSKDGKKELEPAIPDVIGFKDNHDVKEFIKKGFIRVVDDTKTPKKGNVPQTLDGIEHKMKLEIVEGTFDVPTLEAWRDEETDKDVQEVLDKQIKTVKNIDEQRKKAQTRE